MSERVVVFEPDECKRYQEVYERVYGKRGGMIVPMSEVPLFGRWIDISVPFGLFHQAGRDAPGTQIELDDGQRFLIGTGGFGAFPKGAIVARYRVIQITQQQLDE
jgi:hypothetical protein